MIGCASMGRMNAFSPTRKSMVRQAVAGTVVAVAVALLGPASPAAADEHRPVMPDETVSINPQVRPTDLAARSARIAPRVKGWSKPKSIVRTTNAFQSYDIARNAKGQAIVVWSETSNRGVRVWFARLNAKNQVAKRKRLTGWVRHATDAGIAGQVTASIDRRGNAVAGWSQVAKGHTGVRAARIARKGRTTKRWLTKSGAQPMSLHSHGSPNGHTVIWWNGASTTAWGVPRHFVNFKGTQKWRRVPYVTSPSWEPDEGGTASVSKSGLVTATWVERNGDQALGRLRAVTLDRAGRTTSLAPGTGNGMILNSSHTSTASGDITVSFMDQTYENGQWPSKWYSLRRIDGTWRPQTVVPKPNRFGYTWNIAGNNTGKVATLALGYSAENPPQWLTVTAGIQNKPGASWSIKGIHRRTTNEFSFFTPIVHMTANGRTVATWKGNKRNGVSWTKKTAGVKFGRSAVNNDGDFKLVSDRRSKVTMLAPSSSGGWRLVAYTKKL